MMLRYIQPDLKDIAYWYFVLSDDSPKDTFAVSRNPYVKICLFLPSVPGKTKVPDDVRAHALKMKIRFHAVNEANAKCFRGLEQAKAEPRTRRQ